MAAKENSKNKMMKASIQMYLIFKILLLVQYVSSRSHLCQINKKTVW